MLIIKRGSNIFFLMVVNCVILLINLCEIKIKVNGMLFMCELKKCFYLVGRCVSI